MLLQSGTVAGQRQPLPSRARQLWRGWLARAATRKRPDLPDGLGLLRLSLLRFVAVFCVLLRLIAANCGFLQLLTTYESTGWSCLTAAWCAASRAPSCGLLRLIAAYCGLLQIIAVIGSRLHALPGTEAGPAVADDERRPDGAALLADGRLDSWDNGVA